MRFDLTVEVFCLVLRCPSQLIVAVKQELSLWPLERQVLDLHFHLVLHTNETFPGSRTGTTNNSCKSLNSFKLSAISVLGF